MKKVITWTLVVLVVLIGLWAVTFLTDGGVAKGAEQTEQRIARKWRYSKTVVRRHQQLRVRDRNCRARETGRTEIVEGLAKSLTGYHLFSVYTKMHVCTHNGVFRVLSWDQWHEVHSSQINPWHWDRDLDSIRTTGQYNCCPPIEWIQRRFGAQFSFGIGALGQTREVGTWMRVGNYPNSYYREGAWG